MSFTSEYRAAKKKREIEEGSNQSLKNKASGKNTSSGNSFMSTYRAERDKLIAQQEEEESIQSQMTVGKLSSKEEDDDVGFFEQYFQKGALKDGLNAKSIGKAILGTATDFMEDFTTSIVGLPEAAIDFMATIAPYAYQGNLAANGAIVTPEQQKLHNEVVKESKKELDKFVEKDLYDESKVAKEILSNAYAYGQHNAKIQSGEYLNMDDIQSAQEVKQVAKQYLDAEMEADSVLGVRSDSLVQSLGHRVASLALQSAGVPWWITYGISTGGSEAENALKQGATYDEAMGSAMISAGGEIIPELLFGGSGLGEKGLINLDYLTRGISNKTAKVIGDYLVDMGAEGTEEVITEVVSKLGSKLYREENLEEILASEEAFEDYLHSFIGGSAISGIMNIGKAAGHVVEGTDYRDGLTQNEQKVVDLEYKNKLAEAEKDGKLSAREKSKLRDKVLHDMERGYISIETIEEALGGEKYQNYKKAKEWEDSVTQEYKELHSMKRGDMTGEQIDRETELRRMLDHVKQTSTTSQTREQIRSEVMELAKGDRLVESYNERARRGQVFEADLTKYDQKQQQTIQNAINSGTLNNTNRTHELVDFIAKVSADKGVLFDFTNNQKLKESGFAMEGVTRNGFVNTKTGEVTLNVDSKKYLESTVGHEITHVLEGTDFYDTLQKTIFEYAKSKGEYDSRLAKITELYNKYDPDADPLKELTADLVGDYIFADTDFVNRLSTENRNVFQKIYDEIKYLCKVATAGSKEARELEKVRKVFADAYRANGKKVDGTKHSLSAEQQEYFKDSKVRDENGNLKVMYHGTPNGDFTVFKDGTYFTDNKEYADTYQNPGASSISSGKVATDPKTFEVYLDIKKPFDINDAEARRIYIEDYIKGGNAMGINPYLSDAEYAKIKTIDWTEGEDLREFLIENGYDYDGLVLDEGATGGYGDEVKSRGKSYVVFSPEQVKNIDNQKPTSAADIRYSLSEADTAYFDAVVNRDWETAERMVEEAAKKAGYTKVVYHGTDARFTEFDTDEESTAREQHAWMADYPDGTIFLAEDYDVADGYGERVMNLLLDTSEVKVFEEPDMYAHRAMDDMYGYEVYNYPVIAVKGKDMTIYATLDNTLVKSADTVTYGDGGEIIPLSERFNHRNSDIRFSLSESVEETKDLIAVHNLHTSELLETLQLSGLPSPSVAIIKAKDGHDKYGDVSLILPKDAIDPQANKANRIYGSDAWTPTRSNAQVEYEVDYDVQRQFERTVAQLAKNIANGIFSKESVLGMAGIEDSTGLNLSEIAEKMSGYDAVQVAYVAENGGNVDVVYRTKKFDSYGNDALESYIGKVGEQEVARLAVKMLTGERLTADEIATAKDSMMDSWVASKEYVLKRKPELRETRIAKFRENISDIRVEDFVRNAWEFYENYGAKSDEVDYGATGDNLRAAANRSDVAAWVTEKLQGLLSEPAIYNGKDPFTSSGKRRSFKEMHWEYTAENIVRAMNNADARGANVWNVSGEAIIATATPEYKSIDEVRSDKDRLFNAEKGDYEQIKDNISDELQRVTKDIVRTTEHQSDNQYDEEQIIGRVIMEAAQGDKTLSSIKQVFRKNGYRIGDAQAKAVFDLFDHASNVPTGYFEAKPQRVVGFDEVGVYVIPYDADVKLKQELLNNGYAIAEYDPKVEGDRTRVLNQFEEYKFSLSNVGDAPYGNYGTLGKDVAYVDPNAVAPIADNAVSNTENVLPNAEHVSPEEMAEMFPDEPTPQTELDSLIQEKESLESRMVEMGEAGDFSEFESVNERYVEVATRIAELENEISESESGRVNSLDDSDIPPEMEAPYSEPNKRTYSNPFESRDWYEVGRNRSVRAFMTENPEFKPFFQEEAAAMLYDLADTQKAERWYNDSLHYESGGELGFGGQKRLTSQDIAQMLDEWGLTYAQIEEGLTAIVEDNDKVNNAPAKRIEFKLHERLMNGYKDFHTGKMVEPNQAYLDMLYERQVNAQATEAFDSFMATADQYAPEDIAPVKLAEPTPDTMDAPIYQSKDPNTLRGQTTMFEPPKPSPSVATVLTEEAAKEKEKSGVGKKLVSQLVDKGMVFENLSLETGNHELQAKYNSALPSNTEAKAQYFMEHGASGVKPLKDIRREVMKAGKAEQFFNYLYHVHNIDRMTLEDRFDNTPNKTVFGETVTADVSRRKARQMEIANPEFRDWANDVYAYNKHLRGLLVDGGVISQETADLWEKMYPHYVPIRRDGDKGLNINVPLDSNKTGVNNPIKRATGGSGDILPLFETMAMRTEQTYRAIARNSFGIELKNTLGTTLDGEQTVADVDEMIDTIEAQEEKLLKPGTMNSNPTFTVFENGERVEFEITEDMYEALKPAGKILGHRIKALNKMADFRRNLLTVWNPVFALYRNPIKDIQDVAVNSQHPMKTYLNVPNAIFQMATNGKWATEYHQNGGKSNTYFDSQTNEFKEDSIFKKTIGIPVKAVETAGEFIEEIPRLAEYIASRQGGRSVERSMLDAGRVTTNFAAGGDFTKFLNSHGFTFLNASVQGASQHVRNFREAKQQGLKGYVKVLAKYTVAGLPGILLNSLMWDDDEDYEELSDYVKQNYYVVAKTEDGKFVRIPKGRTAAVMQNAMEQMQNLITGDDEVDFQTFYELFMNNIAPNNPIENNILAPIGQVMKNEAWYGGELVPTRLQDLPAAEQFDESTDSISKWLGEATNTSPYKWNYLLDQYSGGAGDVLLPMLTPEAESGDNSLLGNFLAPWKKEITTDKVLNNKNPGDFYDLLDELEVKSNSRNATEEDTMRTMYMDSVSWEMSDLYKKKREVQNSDLPDDEKYEEVRSIQEQINALAENALNNYNHVSINGLYSEAGDKRYNKDAESGKWYEIREKNSDGSDNWYYQMEQDVTKALGISYGEYWNNREEYNYAYENPEKYTFSKAVGGYDSFRSYTSDLWDIKADKDEKGKSINGSRKKKVIEYCDNMDADYGVKIILFKSEYPADDTYNEDIIEYLNNRDDISYKEMETILKYLGFEVDSEGNIYWD